MVQKVVPLGAKGIVQLLLRHDGIVHVVQLLKQLPTGQRVADVDHRAPDDYQRRHAHQHPYQRHIRRLAGGDVHVQHNHKHQQNLQGVDDDRQHGRFFDFKIAFSSHGLRPSLTR